MTATADMPKKVRQGRNVRHFREMPGFWQIDKIVELYHEKIALYERMLKKKRLLGKKYLNFCK